MIDFVNKLASSSKIFDIDGIINYIIFCFNHKTDKSEPNVEKHHILPKAVFPEYSNDSDNIIWLTSKNHYIAHYLLTLSSNNSKYLYAFNMMRRVIKTVDTEDIILLSELYSHKRKEICELISRTNKNRPFPESVKLLFKEIYKDSVIAKLPSDKKFRRIPVSEYYNTPNMILASSLVRHTEEHKIYLSNLYKGRKCYTDGAKTIWVNENSEIPLNCFPGMSPSFSKTCSESQTGLLYYHNPITKEQTKLDPSINKIPSGWHKGRINFGEAGNFFNNFIILKSPDNKDVFYLQKNSTIIPPRYFCYYNSTNYYIADGKISYALSRLGISYKTNHKNKIITNKSAAGKANKSLIGKTFFEYGIYYILKDELHLNKEYYDSLEWV